MPVNLLDFDRDGLIGHCVSLGEKPFRATQLFRWIHQRGQADFDQMTDLAQSLRQALVGALDTLSPLVREHAEWALSQGALN